jgi:hypothetical protein
MHSYQLTLVAQNMATQSLTLKKLHDWLIFLVAFVAQFVAFGCMLACNLPKVLNFRQDREDGSRLRVTSPSGSWSKEYQ